MEKLDISKKIVICFLARGLWRIFTQLSYLHYSKSEATATRQYMKCDRSIFMEAVYAFLKNILIYEC